jgi:hypothetical protein
MVQSSKDRDEENEQRWYEDGYKKGRNEGENGMKNQGGVKKKVYKRLKD